MKTHVFFVLIFVLNFVCLGCQSSQKRTDIQTQETQQDVSKALKSVGEAISQTQLNDQQLKDLENQVRSDPQAQTAIESVTDALTGHAGMVRYCPVDGKHFSVELIRCPTHGVPLQEVE